MTIVIRFSSCVVFAPLMLKSSLAARILEPFERKTSSGNYVREIDGLRCLAIVLVVLFHSHVFFRDGSEPVDARDLTGQDWGTILTYLPNFFIAKGWFGVQIFFVISGMVLAIPFANHHFNGSRAPKLGNYFKRRLVRIEIPYLLTLTFFLISAVLWEGKLFSDVIQHYLAGLFYSHTILFDGALNPLLSVAWTLEIEIQFYLLAPFLCGVFAISNQWLRRGILLLGVPMFELVTRLLVGVHESSLWDHTVIGQMGYFLIGMLIADLFLSPGFDAWSAGGKSRAWDLVGVVAWPATFLMIEWYPGLNLKPFALLICFLSILCGHHLLAIFRNRWLTAVGTMCYSVYLFHNLMLYGVLRPFVFTTIQPGNWPMNFLLIVLMSVLAIALCGILFLIIEKPFARGQLPWRRER
ncbi:acyltransferase [Akkermansiaceae bacterium]|nr:acyltransferase [Akkermansiaceae bacterium]